MNTLVLFGSPHQDGATKALADAFIDALPQGDTVTWVDSFALAAQPCRDCGGCREIRGCVQPDLDAFYPLLEETDRLVIATPIYNRSFSAPLKTLIDRLQPYWSARFVRGERPPIERPKTAFLLTACESDPSEDGAIVEQQLRPALTVLNAAFVGAVHAVGCRNGHCPPAFLKQAQDLAAKA